MKLGEKQRLLVIKRVEFGIYLAEHEDDELYNAYYDGCYGNFSSCRPWYLLDSKQYFPGSTDSSYKQIF